MSPFFKRRAKQIKVCGQRYDVQEKLGRGMLATVYRAQPEDPSVLDGLGIDSVAIKQFYSSALRNVTISTYLRHSIRTRLAMEFEGMPSDVIPRILVNGMDDMSRALVLSYTPGEPLEYPDEDCPYELEDVLGIKCLIRDVYKKICVLMDNGLVHRDVKPANMAVGDDGVGLIDIDVLSRVGEKGCEIPFGTIRYGAPEQLCGEAPALTNDIFPAGVVLGNLMGERASRAIGFPNWVLAGKNRVICTGKIMDYVGDNEAALLSCHRSYPEEAQAEAFGVFQLMRASLHMDPQDRPSTFSTVEQLLDSRPNIGEV